MKSGSLTIQSLHDVLLISFSVLLVLILYGTIDNLSLIAFILFIIFIIMIFI